MPQQETIEVCSYCSVKNHKLVAKTDEETVKFFCKYEVVYKVQRVGKLIFIHTVLVLDLLWHKKLTSIWALWNDGECQSDAFQKQCEAWKRWYASRQHQHHVTICLRRLDCRWTSLETHCGLKMGTFFFFCFQGWPNLLQMSEMSSPHHVAHVTGHPQNAKYHF